MNYIDYGEILYWSLFAALIIAEALVVFKYKLSKKHPARDWIEAGFQAMIIATFLRLLVIQSFAIPTGSMENSLMIGDHPMATKYNYGYYNPFNKKLFLNFRLPKRGEVVIFRDSEGKMLIKRCMALPGDVIHMKNKTLYINGKKLVEPYVVYKDPRVLPYKYGPRDNFGEVKVPEGKIFVMGDNRDYSYDSRFFGFLPVERLRGRALLVYWPINRWRIIKHFDLKA